MRLLAIARVIGRGVLNKGVRLRRHVNEVAKFQVELDPFGYEPSHASKISGLGGEHAPPEEGYVFRTAPLVTPEGHVAISVTFDQLRASRGTLLIEIVGGDSHDRRQVGLRTVGLADLAAAGGTERITMMSDRREAYAIIGYIYDDTDAVANGLSVHIAVGDSPTDDVGGGLPGGMARVPRLAGLAPPSFEHPSSQTWSPAQTEEPAYRSVCRSLGMDTGPAAWPEAYTYQALRYLVGNFAGLRGFGASASPSILADTLNARGATTLMSSSLDPGQWPPVNDLDFCWSINEGPAEDLNSMFWRVAGLIDRVRPSGAVTMVFPFEHGRMSNEFGESSKRNDVEILALKLLAHGHGVAQLKFRPAEQPYRPGTRTHFGLMVRRAEP